MDRYRGTEWDSAPRHAAPPSRPKNSRGPSTLFAVGVTAVAAVALGAVVFVGFRPPAPVPAAIAPTRAPTVTPPQSLPSAVPPRPTQTTSAPTPMPTVPPIDPALADTPAGAFFALMMRADRTFHVEAEGLIEVGNEQAKIALSISVSGQDQDSTQVLAKRRQRAVTSLIVKDGQSFIRPAGEPWQLSAPVAGLQMDLFGHFGADNWQGLTYVGPSERGGRQLHHLRLPQFDWPALSGALLLDADQGGVVIHGLKIDIWVTDSGAPVIAEMWIDGMARDQGVETDVTYEAEYRFSRVGEPIEIEAPTKVDDGGQTTS